MLPLQLLGEKQLLPIEQTTPVGQTVQNSFTTSNANIRKEALIVPLHLEQLKTKCMFHLFTALSANCIFSTALLYLLPNCCSYRYFIRFQVQQRWPECFFIAYSSCNLSHFV
uniref:Uncharacterized protein LOC104219192 n=1 Tax=Nicotiana sylvestris TaxID=4096 RepID=A0A1U7VP10_NICSY|nr:PREDICTED: uncharacterized protein LOC104219192 [Nicotiana sylvestris]